MSATDCHASEVPAAQMVLRPVGSELFDRITRLPEYYPTRAEAAILRERARLVAAATRADTLVELGSGTSEKTRMLLDALRSAGTLRRFVPFDVDRSVLESASAALTSGVSRADHRSGVRGLRTSPPKSPPAGADWWLSWGPRSAT